MKLIELVKQAEQEGQALYPELHKIIHNYNWDAMPQCQNWLEKDLYVRYLGGFCKAIGAKKVCEVGTNYGNSAIGLSLGCPHVDAYDITHFQFVQHQVAKDRNINLITLERYDAYHDIPYNDYDFAFCDIGIHSGEEEKLFHKKLLQIGYEGYAAYDDINWFEMKHFWNQIKQEKVELNWHNQGGFGIVKYTKNKQNQEQINVATDFEEKAA